MKKKGISLSHLFKYLCHLSFYAKHCKLWEMGFFWRAVFLTQTAFIFTIYNVDRTENNSLKLQTYKISSAIFVICFCFYYRPLHYFYFQFMEWDRLEFITLLSVVELLTHGCKLPFFVLPALLLTSQWWNNPCASNLYSQQRGHYYRNT